MKKILIALFFLPLCIFSQNYVDILKIGYSETFNNDFEGTNKSTQVNSFEAGLTIPIVINKDYAFITGFDFSKNNLQLFPDSLQTNLYSTILKVGLASTYSKKWSSTLILLPKIASDYKNISSDDFYVGGLALFKYQKNENLKYRFGIYGSTEAFGFFTTPILGWYYLSPNTKFEMDVSLPIAADINYKLGKTTLGVDYYGIGRSFALHGENQPNEYVDLSSLEFASYIQYNAFENSILLRGKFGYSSNNYEVYADGDSIDLGVSAFTFGDDRKQLNPDLSGGFFLKVEAIYRFQLAKKKQSFPKKQTL